MIILSEAKDLSFVYNVRHIEKLPESSIFRPM
jgi:hypothetical protein